MKLEHRLQSLELKFVIKKKGCNPTMFIVIPEDCRNGAFISDTYKPDGNDIEKYLKQLKDTGEC